MGPERVLVEHLTAASTQGSARLVAAAGLPLAGSRIGRPPGRRRKARARSWTLAGSGSTARGATRPATSVATSSPTTMQPVTTNQPDCARRRAAWTPGPFRRTQCHPTPNRAHLAPTMRPPTTSAAPPAGGSRLAPAAACGRWTEPIKTPEPRSRRKRDERFHWPGTRGACRGRGGGGPSWRAPRCGVAALISLLIVLTATGKAHVPAEPRP